VEEGVADAEIVELAILTELLLETEALEEILPPAPVPLAFA